MNGRDKSSALEFLDSLIEDTPEVRRAAQRERLRLELARFMKKAREAAELTQTEVAKALGVTQAWVSKLESPNYDHKLESVLTYFDAIEAEMNLSVAVGESTFQIWGESPVRVWEGFSAIFSTESWLPVISAMEEVESAFSWWKQIADEEIGTQTGHIVNLRDYIDLCATSPNQNAELREANAI